MTILGGEKMQDLMDAKVAHFLRLRAFKNSENILAVRVQSPTDRWRSLSVGISKRAAMAFKLCPFS